MSDLRPCNLAPLRLAPLLPCIFALFWPDFSAQDLASVAVGEVGGSFIWGDEAEALKWQTWVMWVVRNRWQKLAPPRPDSGFYGRSPIVPAASLQAAKEVLQADTEDDPTGGMLYVLSEQDRQRLRFPAGDVVANGYGCFKLHFYRTWPDHD